MALIQEKYCSGTKPLAKFLTVYIEESSTGKGLQVKPIADYHKSIEDRLEAANRFVKEQNFQGEVVCDTMRNEAMTRYNAHPERICIVLDGVLVHTGGKGPLVFYDIDGVIDWLDAALGMEKGWKPPAATTTAGKNTSLDAADSAIDSEVAEQEGECSA
eukprot:gene20847-23674_t